METLKAQDVKENQIVRAQHGGHEWLVAVRAVAATDGAPEHIRLVGHAMDVSGDEPTVETHLDLPRDADVDVLGRFGRAVAM